jgi:hypothetical protein
MKNKKLKDLLKKIRERAEQIGDEELKKLCKDAEAEAETQDDGSNPGGNPPPPPGPPGKP